MILNFSLSFGLLLGFSAMKAFIVSYLALNLFHRWKKQPKRYWTDFPYLMGIFFSIYAISKIFDIGLYYYMRDQPESGHIIESTLKFAEFLGKLRISMTYFTVAPLVFLMLIIWFQNQKKIQIGVFIGWSISSFLSILLAKTYSELLVANFVISIIPLLISIITYFILHLKKKMGTINNFVLAVGWILVLITQIIRPIWSSLGESIWGLSWIGEILETVPFLFISYGYHHPARYYQQRRIKRAPQKNNKNQSILIADNESI